MSGQKGYVVVESDVSDSEAYARYTALSGPAVGAFGGKYLASGAPQMLEGSPPRPRVVIVEFESLDKASEFYRSRPYQDAKAKRAGAASVNMYMVEGRVTPSDADASSIENGASRCWSIDSWRKFWSNPSPEVAFKRVPTIVAPDVVAVWPRGARPVRGPHEYAQRVADLLTLVPDFRLELAEHAVNGDSAFIRWNARGTGPDGPFEGIGADRIKVRDGLVVENLVLSDLEIFAALAQTVEQRQQANT